MEKKTVAVVVTYNRKTLLLESLQALLALQEGVLSVLVVDNASTDGTAEAVAPFVDGARLIYRNTGKNLGGAGGFAFGIRQAVEMGADYLWLMDDDCVVRPGSLAALLSFAKVKGEFGFLSSQALWKDGTPAKMNIQRKNIYRELTDFSKNTPIRLASFVSLFLPAKVVEQVGLPFEEFFIWGDDWEYTARISAKYPSYFVKDSVVEHRSAQNMGVDISAEEESRLDRYFYAYRNEGYFYRKQGVRGRFYSFLKRQYHRFKILTKSKDQKKKRLSVLSSGAKAAKDFDPPVRFAYSPTTPIRVLEFFGEPLSYGGQEAFILNMYRKFTDTRIHYTFFTPFVADNRALLELAAKRGDRVVADGHPHDSRKRKLYIRKSLKALLKKERFDIIHIHSGSIYTLLFAAKEAKKRGIRRIIVHSHAAGGSGLSYRLIKFLADRQFVHAADVFLACSRLAAACKFPPDIMQNEGYTVIDNGIDTANFTFSADARSKIRQELGLGDEPVLCHVGRFDPEKNHPFLLRIAKELKQKQFHFSLLLVGAGRGEAEARAFCQQNDLTSEVRFLGLRQDIPAILSASDLFLLPSLYEGLSISSIEAQCAGLPTLCSDQVTKETAMTDLIRFLPIQDPTLWAEQIMATTPTPKDKRASYAACVKNAGYDAISSANILEDLYRGHMPHDPV